ncbi:MAG: glycosyltransferase family 4 protein [Spirochaetota bacterium]
MNQKKINILIINYEFPPLGGGGGVATYDLALEWVKIANVHVITSSFKGLPSYENVNGIHVHRVRILFRKSRDAATFISMFSYLPAGFIQALSLVLKYKFDVINTHFVVPSGPLGYAISKLFGIPNVLSLHGGDIYDPSKKLSPHRNRFFKAAVRFLLNRADVIVAQSSNTRNNAIKYYAPKKEIQIIPLAFHPPVMPKTSRKKLGLNKKDFICITVGRLIKRKSIDVLIRAIALVNNPAVKLLIMGDGPEREYLESLVSQLSLGGKVQFLGFVADEQKYAYLSQSDLFVLTSMHEGFGIVFMESMYCGLPIITTNHGGQVDFLTHGENALLINVGDTKGCAESIMKFYTDKKLYTHCSENNKKKITTLYAEKVAMRYMNIFTTLVNTK